MTTMPNVIVVGGAGYIGSHCCKALAEAGYRPVCYDNLSTGHRSFVKWGPFVAGDLQDQNRLADTIRTHDAVAVLHFAASSLVGESVSDPGKYYRNNVEGTCALLRAMRDADCKTLVFSSSGAVYGRIDKDLIEESELLQPINPYGRTKRIVEDMLADFGEAYGLASACLRYFNASGADIGGEIGENHEPETHLIPRAILATQGRLDDFAIFGDDYGTPDGTAVRDYIHVSDLARAHVLALNHLRGGGAGGCFNLGTGRGYSVMEIIGQIRRETNRETPFVIKPRRHGDPPILVANPDRARAVLGFQPKYSDLATIVGSAWRWHQRAT